MTDARERILSRVRAATGARHRTDEQTRALQDRIFKPTRGPIPGGVDHSLSDLLEMFETKAVSHDCTVERVGSTSEAWRKIVAFMADNALRSELVAAPSTDLDEILKNDSGEIDIRRGAARETDETSLTPALCAVAETGTMVTVSGVDTPTTLNFVPENQVIIVRATEIVPCYEDAWDEIRARGKMPRTVNWLSGPSRSADIGQVLYLGAHGPRRQHIIVYGDNGSG